MERLEFRWTWLGADIGGREVVYQLGITQVARLIDRLDGSWFAVLDCHLASVDRHRRTRDCSSYESGRRGVELWALRHESRLRAEIDAQHQEWLARQALRLVPKPAEK
ncbi:hypothetical protein [Pseudoxanthomonas mexicana]